MPWSTPSLRDVRSAVRDAVRGRLPGADANVPNSVLRVVSDAMGALCHLVLQYVDWLSKQLLPDTAETEWLDRHGDIWLVNADGTTGRKLATPAQGTAVFIATAPSVIVPIYTQLVYAATATTYQTTAEITTGAAGSPTPAPIIALDAGAVTNLPTGTTLQLATDVISPLDPAGLIITVDTLDGGTDDESDDDLRLRVLARIRKPPMGGDADDYIAWTESYPGVTRAWSYPLEMGIGTVTVRFMMDDLRADYGGFPLPDDVLDVATYLDTVRPVAVKDFFTEAPIPFPVNIPIRNLNPGDQATRNNITASLRKMFYERQSPGQTWYEAWTDEAIMGAVGVISYNCKPGDTVMPNVGCLPVLGDITYA
jgi:uncharacterized phage protein gp47/JayE